MRHTSAALALVLAAAALSVTVAAAAKPKAAPRAAKIVEGTGVGQRLPAFEAQATTFGADGAPQSTKLVAARRARPTVYAFVGTHCPTTAAYLGRLGALETRLAGKVDFVFLYPNKTDSADEKRAFHQQHALKSPMIDDQGGKLAKLFGAARTAEVVLVGKNGVIAYRGAIDDNRDQAQVTRAHLAVAIDEHLAGKPVSTPMTQVSA